MLLYISTLASVGDLAGRNCYFVYYVFVLPQTQCGPWLRVIQDRHLHPWKEVDLISLSIINIFCCWTKGFNRLNAWSV